MAVPHHFHHHAIVRRAEGWHRRHHVLGRHGAAVFHRRRVWDGRGVIVGGRPHGCPYQFCGCEASLTIFHRIISALNLAANWLRFRHVAPAPGMAAVAPNHHHVLVLERHVRGPYWLVHDGNSGGHLTRNHIRNIAGFTVVDPYA